MLRAPCDLGESRVVGGGGQDAGRTAVAEDGRRDDVGLGGVVQPERQAAELDTDQQNSGAGLSPRQAGSQPEARRPAGAPEATSCRNPIRVMAIASRLGVAMPVEETVTMVSIAAALRRASSSAPCAAWQKSSRAPARKASPRCGQLRGARYHSTGMTS
jgi:hypothetical protein